MQKAIVEAAKGSADAQRNLALLGLSLADLDGLSPDEQFKLIADRLSRIEDPTIRAAMAMEFFGRSGTTLLPMLVNGAAGIDAFAAQARALGLVMSTENAEAAHKFSQALDILWRVIKSGVNAIGAALAAGGLDDRIANATERTAKGVEGLRQDVKNNKPAFA
jgi:hypothetical protein